MMLLRREFSHCAAAHLDALRDPEDDWTYICTRKKNVTITYISVYIHPTNTARALTTQYKVSKAIEMIRGPYLIMGDMNMSPNEIIESEWGIVHQTILVTPSNSLVTCYAGENGSLIDYGLASENMAPLIQYCEANTTLPFKTHYGVEYTLRADLDKVMINKLIRPHKIPNIPKEDWHEALPWDKCI